MMTLMVMVIMVVMMLKKGIQKIPIVRLYLSLNHNQANTDSKLIRYLLVA